MLLDDVWLGGKESPCRFPNMGDVFVSPSKICKESLKSKDMQYCVRQEKNVNSRSRVQRANLTCHVIRINSVSVKNIWIFARFLKLLSKILRAAEKNKERVQANCIGFSADFFGTQLVEMPGKQKFKFWQLLVGACYLSGSLFLNNYDFIQGLLNR